jgi:predicted ATPase
MRIGSAVTRWLVHATEAKRLAEATQVKWVLAETLRLRGDLLLITGDRVSAKASYCDAIALARRQHAKLFELRAATSLARLWRDEGKAGEARDLLASALSARRQCSNLDENVVGICHTGADVAYLPHDFRLSVECDRSVA